MGNVSLKVLEKSLIFLVKKGYEPCDWFAQCKEIQIPESGKFLVVETEIPEIWENFACQLWNPGLLNPEYSSRNLESH